MLAELTCLASKSERRTTKVRVTTGEMSVDARAAEVMACHLSVATARRVPLLEGPRGKA